MANPSGLCKCGCSQRTTIARWSHTEKGYIRGQPKDYVVGHNNKQYQEGYEIRDCGYLTPCWVWTGRVDARSGYGWVSREGKYAHAHRTLYQEKFGSLPPGHAQVLHHLCENRTCVNPDHLRPMTCGEHKVAHGPLSYEIAALIRASDETHAALGRKYGVSAATIWQIRNNRTYQEPH